MQILVPAYFYPDPDDRADPWLTLAASAPSVAITAILNPASGPGTAVDPKYSKAVATLRRAGGRVVAYVSTSYGDRDARLVIDEIDRHARFYELDGFFLDEMSSSHDRLDYYERLSVHVRGMGRRYRIIGNPGTNTQESYLSVADTLVTFERAGGYDDYQTDPWVAGHGAGRFAHLLYGVGTASDMQRAVSLAAQRNVGLLYVTDDDGANPWDRLPSYWPAEVAAIGAVPRPGAIGALLDWLRRLR